MRSPNQRKIKQVDMISVCWDINGSPVYLKDVHICFGLCNAPYVFATTSNFNIRCLVCRGCHQVVIFLDDFIVVASNFDSCQKAQSELIELLGSVGYQVSWKKCSSPST